MPSTLYCSPELRYGEKFFEFSQAFRSIALLIDEKPTAIKNYFDLPGIQFLASDNNSTALERTRYLEAFSYGDPGVLLASPGPSLSGLMLRELGTEVEIQQFYHWVATQRMRTFFALTEPEKGSDAANIQTRLTRIGKQYYLSGEKCFFGNAAVADMGIVLARLNNSPIGIRAIWLTPEILRSSNIERGSLAMSALKGAQIGYAKFHHVEIAENNILGASKSACAKGFLSIAKVFNRLRTGLGALAIGQAQGIYDLLFQSRQQKKNFDRQIFSGLNDQLSAAREYLHFAAGCVDKDALDAYHASVSKVQATRTAEAVISTCFKLVSLSELEANPYILKAYRDVFAWEFMEGTAFVQKQLMKTQLKGNLDYGKLFNAA